MRRFVLSPKGRKLHRSLGLIFGIYLITAALSGVAHNIMALLYPSLPPIKPAAHLSLPPHGLDPAAAARQAGVWSAIERLEVRAIGGRPVYQFITADAERPRYVDMATGQTLADADRKHAAEIAARALPHAAVINSAYLTAFDAEYGRKNQILPVYRFDADDDARTRVYISTATGTVVYATNDARATLSALFRNLHLLAFLNNHDLQMWILLALALGALAMAGLGMAMLWVRRTKT